MKACRKRSPSLILTVMPDVSVASFYRAKTGQRDIVVFFHVALQQIFIRKRFAAMSTCKTNVEVVQSRVSELIKLIFKLPFAAIPVAGVSF